LDDRPALGVQRRVLGGLERRARGEVAAVGLAVLRAGPEPAVGVEPLRTVGVLVVAGPLDAAAAPQLVVAEAGVVAEPAPRALLPRLEGRLGVAPGNQRAAVLVAQIHPSREVDKDVEVGPG